MQIWLHGFPVPGTVAPLAARTEQQGFHGLLLADSQVLVGDPYVECALAAAATTNLSPHRAAVPSSSFSRERCVGVL